MTSNVIYISCPYTGTPEEREERYLSVEKFCAVLVQQGHTIISPITHNHNMLIHNPDMPVTFDFWNDYCLNLLSVCDELWVLMDDGWITSKGITGELAFAHEMNIPIKYFNPVTYNPIPARDIFKQLQVHANTESTPHGGQRQVGRLFQLLGWQCIASNWRVTCRVGRWPSLENWWSA